jgi:hypothetical protein
MVAPRTSWSVHRRPFSAFVAEIGMPVMPANALATSRPIGSNILERVLVGSLSERSAAVTPPPRSETT